MSRRQNGTEENPPDHRGSPDTPREGRLPTTMYGWRVDSIYRALGDRGLAEGDLKVDDLTALGHLDQFHFLGVDTNDDVIRMLGLDDSVHVLDLGSGVGGTARYLAHRTGCRVSGVELREQFVDTARDLTRRVGLDDRVKYIHGDALTCALDESGFDHLVSLLVILHIQQRARLFERCRRALRPGATFFIEDYVALGEPRDAESEVLRELFMAPNITRVPAYLRDLEIAGFVDIEIADRSAVWRDWCSTRYQRFLANRDSFLAMYPPAYYEARKELYKAGCDLFDGGRVGGARFTGRVPGEAERRLRRGRASLPRPHGSRAQMLEFEPEPRPCPASVPATSTALQSPVEHHNLQFHFFADDRFLSMKFFGTPSLLRGAVWRCDLASGAVEHIDLEWTGNTSDLAQPRLAGQGWDVDQTGGAGRLVLPDGDEIAFDDGPIYSWNMPELAGSVTHRPSITGVWSSSGVDREVRGYAKQYSGLYPRHWGYRFIHAATDGPTMSASDATFGDWSYGFMDLYDGGERDSAAFEEFWLKRDFLRGTVGGQAVRVDQTTIAQWAWDLQTAAMHSRLVQRICRCDVSIGSRRYTGYSMNERCLGTLG